MLLSNYHLRKAGTHQRELTMKNQKQIEIESCLELLSNELDQANWEAQWNQANDPAENQLRLEKHLRNRLSVGLKN